MSVGPAFWTARLKPEGTTFDSILYVRAGEACEAADGSEACVDRPGELGNGGETASVMLPSGPNSDGVYYVFVDGKTAEDQGDYEVVFEFWAGNNCNSGGAVEVELEPGAQKTTFVGMVPFNDPDNAECAGSGLGDGRPDVVYRFFPPGIEKTITVAPAAGSPGFQPYLFATDTCGGTSKTFAEACASAPAPGSPVSITTTSSFVWVDGEAPNESETYTMTIETK